MLAKIDYVTDPEDRSARWHYDRPDRDYHAVSYATFEVWCKENEWVSGRASYYREIEHRIIAQRLDHLLEQRFTEIDDISENLKYMKEWVSPLRDQYGQVKRYPLTVEMGDPRKGTYKIETHPFAGLPMYAIPFTSMDKLVSAFLKLDTQLMLKRGDATSRSETQTTINSSGRPSVLDPQTVLTQVTKEERAAMAKALLMQRQPELLRQPEIEIETLTERGAGEDDGDTI